MLYGWHHHHRVARPPPWRARRQGAPWRRRWCRGPSTWPRPACSGREGFHRRHSGCVACVGRGVVEAVMLCHLGGLGLGGGLLSGLLGGNGGVGGLGGVGVGLHNVGSSSVSGRRWQGRVANLAAAVEPTFLPLALSLAEDLVAARAAARRRSFCCSTLVVAAALFWAQAGEWRWQLPNDICLQVAH
jgi:hypothetical protein